MPFESLFMKTLLLRCLTAFLLLFLFSCTKELSKENGTIPDKGNFYATINGKSWDADSLQLVLVNNGGVSINGLSKTGEQISMVLPVFQTGTYTLNAQSVYFALYTNILSSNPVIYVSDAGTAGGSVTISAIDTINHFISGNFTFTLINTDDNTTKTITQGVFEYIPYNGGGIVNPPPAGTDILKATVGSTPYNASQIIVQPASGQLVISSLSADIPAQHLDLLMPVNITPGTYSLDLTQGIYGALYFNDPLNPLISNNNGTLTIISNDPTSGLIKGTFSFTGSSLTNGQTVVITNGYFSVNY